MRRPASRFGRAVSSTVNMTPMIDVVFLLLIFFVCTASFQTLEELLPATLRSPGVTTASPLPPEIQELDEVLIRVTVQEGILRWTVNETPYADWQQFRQIVLELAQLQSNLPVTLDVQGQVSLGKMIDVYDLCRMAGFTEIRFAAQAP